MRLTFREGCGGPADRNREEFSEPIFGSFEKSALDNITGKTKHLKMNKEVGMLMPKNIANTSGVGKSNNYDDIYIPPYSNTH